ncbi:MAG: hypothetical protein IPI79_09435 [Moraxellaceae bacterium]|nr:hypothetical protein [Moraxellaceae bacterium]MBL0229649.1 hypothetical protein [Moraxellaceae bacterium]MBL0231103.1 hypothetical protein [Moraxellaceae bacterium]
MMALLAIALAWAHKVGEWQHKVIKPLVIKKHGRLEKAFSIWIRLFNRLLVAPSSGY